MKMKLNFIIIGLLLFTVLLQSCLSTKNTRGSVKQLYTSTVDLPFEMVSKLIVFEVEINGIKGRFLFDNGFSLSAVNEKFAKKAGIKFNSSSSVRDANSKRFTLKETTVDTVNILNYQFNNTGFYQINTAIFFPCDSIDGVIGASIINKINWQIDFETKTISLSKDNFLVEGKRMEIGFLKNNSSITKLLIQDELFTCKIDFGRSAGIKLDTEKSLNLFTNLKAVKTIGSNSISAGGLGKASEFYQILETVPIKTKSDILLKENMVLLSKNLKYDGYLGLDFFQDFKLTVNSKDRHYILSPREKEREISRDTSYGVGIYLINDEWQIISINPADSALNKFQLGDEIISINDQLLSEFSNICDFADYKKILRQQKSDLKIKTVTNTEAIKIQYKTPVHIFIK